MAKDKAVNPATAQRKLEKQKALKKSKNEAQSRRNEKLARRNPDRIQRQISELKSAEESGQPLRPREKQILEALERDLRSVNKAREELGEKAPRFERDRGGGGGARGRGDGGVLGKRRRDNTSSFGFDRDAGEESSETDEEVRRIPMPRDTPPPVPGEYLRKKKQAGVGERERERGPHPLPSKPVVEPKTVYESAPDIRDLRQEAINKFVPAAVRAKQGSIKGQGKLLEPEEMDRLEKSGYMAGPGPGPGRKETDLDTGQSADAEEQRLLEEEKRFNEELKRAHVEEVEDEEA